MPVVLARADRGRQQTEGIDAMGDREEQSNLPPIPDGGLSEGMPEWLRRPPAWRTLADREVEAPEPAETSALPEPDDSVIDPRTFLTDDDLPLWLRNLGRGRVVSREATGEARIVAGSGEESTERTDAETPAEDAPAPSRFVPATPPAPPMASPAPERSRQAPEAPAPRPHVAPAWQGAWVVAVLAALLAVAIALIVVLVI